MSQISESILSICQAAGIKFVRQGGEMYGPCPFHQDGKRPNFRISEAKNSWFCDVCGEGGGVVEFLAKKQGREKKEVFKELAGRESQASSIVATYDYTDQFGNMLYQVCRMQPKTFRQRRSDGKGGWIWNMEGIERVLYRLRDICNPKNKFVWIVEGEKDVETLRGIGMAATCNVGGAGKWSDAYSQCLKDKEVVLCGDNDEPGRKHIQQVAESVEQYAACIRKIEIPQPFKDISDFAASFSNREKFSEALAPLVDSAQVMLRGGLLPIKNIAELEQEYLEHVKAGTGACVDLSKWIPELSCVRPLVAGELACIVGDTGTSKTYVLQHIALECGVPTLLFELELPGSLTFERFMQIKHGLDGNSVWRRYAAEEKLEHQDLRHIYTCTKPRLTPGEIESLILKSELKIGVRPVLVIVDYVQLVQGIGRSRYERVSDIAEQMKVVAKATGTVIMMASQVGRDKESPEITLHDAKDSGSIENSSGLIIGIWRDQNLASTLNLRVLKNTKGTPSEVIPCQISLGMQIKSKSLFA
jgi:5S rRNA maturation endonuclease (ribonuclease M5)